MITSKNNLSHSSMVLSCTNAILSQIKVEQVEVEGSNKAGSTYFIPLNACLEVFLKDFEIIFFCFELIYFDVFKLF